MTIFDISEGYPNSHDKKDICVMAGLNGAWVNYNCDHLLGYVCEVVAGIEQPTTLSPPTDAPDVDCHEQPDGWIQRPGKKFTIAILWSIL